MKKIPLLALFVFAGLVAAAPAPWGIALNHETKECGGYWGGDEYVSYRLPDGWREYRPTYGQNGSKVETEVGTCDFQMRKEEDCCRQLGYRFVAANVGEGPKKLMDRPQQQGKSSGFGFWVAAALFLAFILVSTVILAVALFVGFRMWRRRKGAGKEKVAAGKAPK
jgi:hypothetical protein